MEGTPDTAGHGGRHHKVRRSVLPQALKAGPNHEMAFATPRRRAADVNDDTVEFTPNVEARHSNSGEDR